MSTTATKNIIDELMERRSFRFDSPKGIDKQNANTEMGVESPPARTKASRGWFHTQNSKQSKQETTIVLSVQKQQSHKE